MSNTELEARTAVFAKDEGIWDAEMEIRPAPGAAPLKQNGVSTNRRACGGRWLLVDFRADSGFEGHGVYGWDRTTGKYTANWIDSLQAVMARGEGQWDEATRTMTFVMETAHQGRTIRYREITQTQPDGSQLYRQLVPLPDGSEHEMIRTVYRRRA